jgi:hypothetical protein
MAKVFISFIHEEENVAHALQDFLIDKLGMKRQDIFLSSDIWQTRAGEDWLKRIRRELKSAKAVILMLSRVSVRRPWVNFEAGAAWLRKEELLIPVCFGDLSKGKLPKPFADLRAVNLRKDAYFLIKSVNDCLALSHIPPVPFLADTDPCFRKVTEALERWAGNKKKCRRSEAAATEKPHS